MKFDTWKKKKTTFSQLLHMRLTLSRVKQLLCQTLQAYVNNIFMHINMNNYQHLFVCNIIPCFISYSLENSLYVYKQTWHNRMQRA